MRTQFILWFCFGVAILAGCGDKGSSLSADREKLQGGWDLVFQQMNGQKLPDEKAAKMFHGRMVFTGDKIRYTVELPGFDLGYAYTLRPDRQPKEIDLELTAYSDPKAGSTKEYGIYSLEDGDLRICYSNSKRPTDFKAEAGSGNVLIVLKRNRSVDH